MKPEEMGAGASADYDRPSNRVQFQEYPADPDYRAYGHPRRSSSEDSLDAEDDQGDVTGDREDTRTSLGQQIQNRAQNAYQPRLAGLIRIDRRENKLAVDIVKKEEYDAWKLNKIKKVIKKKITAKSYYAPFFSEKPKKPPPPAPVDDGEPPRRMKPVVLRPKMSTDLWGENDGRSLDTRSEYISDALGLGTPSVGGSERRPIYADVDRSGRDPVDGGGIYQQSRYEHVNGGEIGYRKQGTGDIGYDNSVSVQEADMQPVNAQPSETNFGDVHHAETTMDNIRRAGTNVVVGQPAETNWVIGRPVQLDFVNQEPAEGSFVNRPIVETKLANSTQAGSNLVLIEAAETNLDNNQPVSVNITGEQPDHLDGFDRAIRRSDYQKVPSPDYKEPVVVRVQQDDRQDVISRPNDNNNSNSTLNNISPLRGTPSVNVNGKTPREEKTDKTPREQKTKIRKGPVTSYNTYKDAALGKEQATPRRVIRNPITGLREEVEIKEPKKKKQTEGKGDNMTPRARAKDKKDASTRVEKDEDNDKADVQKEMKTKTLDESPPDVTDRTNDDVIPRTRSQTVTGTATVMEKPSLPTEACHDSIGHIVPSLITESETSVVSSRLGSVVVNAPRRFERHLEGVSADQASLEYASPSREPVVIESGSRDSGQPLYISPTTRDPREGDKLPYRTGLPEVGEGNPSTLEHDRKMAEGSNQWENTESRDSLADSRDLYPESHRSFTKARASHSESNSSIEYSQNIEYSQTPSINKNPALPKQQSVSSPRQLRHRLVNGFTSSPRREWSNDRRPRDIRFLRQAAKPSDEPVAVAEEPKLRGPYEKRPAEQPGNKQQTNSHPKTANYDTPTDKTTAFPAQGEKKIVKENTAPQSKDKINHGRGDLDEQNNITPLEAAETPRRFTVYNPTSSPQHKPPPRRSFLSINTNNPVQESAGRTPRRAVGISPRSPRKAKKAANATTIMVKEVEPPVLKGKRFERAFPAKIVS